MNLVTLHNFLFIPSFKATHPKISEVQAIPELGSHSHPTVLICATATSQMCQMQNYLPVLLIMAQGRGQASLQDGCHCHRDETKK